MNKLVYLLIIALPFLSCDKSSSNKNKIKVKKERPKSRFYKQPKDRKYKKFGISYPLSNNTEEILELYVTKKGDSVYNQVKRYKNDVLDSINSNFYDLTVRKTKTPNIYKGTIYLNSVYNNYKLNETRERLITFHYIERNYDSISISTIKPKTNRIDFEYLNIDDKQLTGILIDQYNNDTIINGEKMVRMRETNLLVDYYNTTDNLFLDVYEFKKHNKINFGLNDSTIISKTNRAF